eukprot:4741106-Pleurochrysis_carterae.AAC.2
MEKKEADDTHESDVCTKPSKQEKEKEKLAKIGGQDSVLVRPLAHLHLRLSDARIISRLRPSLRARLRTCEWVRAAAWCRDGVLARLHARAPRVHLCACVC